jgi:hypothetical protein
MIAELAWVHHVRFSLTLMNWLAERLILSSAIALLLATGARAQAVVQGVVPLGRPDDALDAERRATERADQPWSLNLAASELSETNVQPGLTANSAAVGSELNGNLARTWTSRRGGVTFNGNASEFLYRGSASGLNQFFYGVGVGASYLVSPRVSFNVSENLTSSYAQDVTTLTDSGLLPPKVLTRANSASTALSYDLSPRTHIRWGLNDQNVSVDSSQFAAASTLGTSINISRQLSRSQTVGVTTDYQRITGAGESENIGLLGTWQRPIGKSFTVNAAGGIRPYTLPGQSSFRTAPAGSLGITAHLRRSDTLGLSYDRSVEQGLGNGTLLTQGVAASYGLSLGRRLTLAGSAGYRRGADPVDASHLLVGQNGSTSVRYVVTQNLTASINYSLYQITNSPNPNVSSRRAAVSLTYGRKFH